MVGGRHEVSEATVNRFLSLTCSLPLLVLGVSACDIGFDGTNPDLNLGPSIMVGEDLSVGHPGAVLDTEEENAQDPVCAASAPLECGALVSASTAESTAQSEIDSYSCGEWDASGPEIVFSFTAPQSGAFTARLVETELNTDLDVYILGEEGAGCDPSNCISYGNQEATWEAEADSTYYVIVDGFLGDSYVGAWVNLGAGTVNSNLTNLYGSIKVQLFVLPVGLSVKFVSPLQVELPFFSEIFFSPKTEKNFKFSTEKTEKAKKYRYFGPFCYQNVVF